MTQLCDDVHSWRRRRADLAERARAVLALGHMVAAHADLVKQVAASTVDYRESQGAGLVRGELHTWSAKDATGPNSAQKPTASS